MEHSAKRLSARRLRPWGVGLPIALTLALEVFRFAVLTPRLGPRAAANVTGALIIVGVITFSLIIWRVLERAERDLTDAYQSTQAHERQLVALHEAALSITAALDLPTVLRRVVDESRAVIGSRYGAVAVVNGEGRIEEFVTSGVDEDTVRRLGPPPVGEGLLGLVIAQRQPVRLPDIARDPRAVGFPPGHPPMKTLLAVPLFFEQQVLGSLYLSDRGDGRAFDAADQETLERFAAQAAIAVANARLDGERKRLSLLEERERIGMDLHDGVLQTLYATGLGLEAAMDDMERDPGGTRAGVGRAIDRLNATIRDIRYYIFDLRAEQQEREEDLAARLRQLVDSVEHTGIDVELDVQAGPEGLPRRVQWELWHIAREAVSNAVRHSHGRRIDVRLRIRKDALTLEVVDDGDGFDPAAEVGPTHRGLRNMRHRAESLGGRIRVTSASGKGTTLAIHVPFGAEGGAVE